ncbi:MAG: peptidoglycan-binding protein [Blastocatellia bacterium]|nr:peptidoglycan-binding protein [Blastocatellia bacterium]
MFRRFFSSWLVLSLLFSAVILSSTETYARGGRGSRAKATAKRKSVVKKSSRNARGRAAARPARGKKTFAKATRGKKGRRYEQVARNRGRRRGYDAANSLPPSGVGRNVSAMPAERVREIQEALIKQGYLQGDATGQYDRTTVDAMTSYQKSNNLRATGYPTAESLRALGLTKAKVSSTDSEDHPQLEPQRTDEQR